MASEVTEREMISFFQHVANMAMYADVVRDRSSAKELQECPVSLGMVYAALMARYAPNQEPVSIAAE